ncbi:rRNA methyltransferase [Bacillus sp. 1P10SD]|uniref:rRNA methyltransferase n=1 Tax=Bacillus sp. 1P10SD TaxID=3132265 RepID=UPI0039A73E8B
MWVSVNGKLIQTTDNSRTKFRTNISRSVINDLNEVAANNNTHINYLIESGLQNVLSKGYISFNKELRPTDRVQYKTTYDKDLLDKVKEFAKNHDLFINDVIEYSVNFVDVEKAKKSNYKHRIE